MTSIKARQTMLSLALMVVCSSASEAQNGSLRTKTRPRVNRAGASSYPTRATEGGADDDAFSEQSVDENTGYHDRGYDAAYDEGAYSDGGCDESFGCGSCARGCGGGWFSWIPGWGCTGSSCGVMTAGVELTFLQPYFESNPAVTQLTSDGNSLEAFTDIEFAYDVELSPRVWLEFSPDSQVGGRVVWWQFDHGADPLSISPDDNGFGRISHPDFGDVDLSTTVPGSIFSTATQLQAWTIDVEGTRKFDSGCWKWLAAAGIRYAEIEQNYLANLVNAAGNLQGTIDYAHQSEGVGPTLFLRAQRPLLPGFALFGSARGSLLFGDSSSRLEAVEDLDLDDQLTTRRTTNRNDLLPIGEIQVGLQALPPCSDIWQPYFHVALEAQHWGGAGNASSEDGSLGFFGFNVALGVSW